MTRRVYIIFLGVCGLAPVISLSAQNESIRIAVVVDMTPAGKEVEHPTPAKPAYYMPVVVGYQELGDPVADHQKQTPWIGEVQGIFAGMLARQGYRVMTKESAPSLLLVFRWGDIRWQGGPFPAGGDAAMAYVLGDRWRDLVPLPPIGNDTPTVEHYLRAPKWDDHSTDPATTEILTSLTNRYILLVSAFDFNAFRRNKVVLLWRARLSTGSWGHSLREVLPALMAAGAPMLGHETPRPKITNEAAIPMGRVIVGTPVPIGDFKGVATAPNSTAFDKVEADTERTLALFSDRADGMMPGASSRSNAGVGPAEMPDNKSTSVEAAAEDASEGTVQLPPYIVGATRSRIPWHYAAIPGFEILSCCNAADTEKFAESLHDQQARLDAILPPSLQPQHTVPTAVILLNASVEKTMAKDATALSAESGEKSAQAGNRITFVLMPQIRLSDDDTVSIDIVFEYHPGLFIEFDPDYVLSALTNRAPPLPAWFAAGTFGLYQELLAADGAGANTWAWVHGGRELIFLPMANRPKRLAPMREFVTEPPPPGGTEESRQWLSESLLLVRWSLDDDTGGRRQALWKFADLASAAPVTERMFRNCFGVGFEEMDERLSEYLPAATKNELTLTEKAEADAVQVRLRSASEAEQARILGDWQRKEIEYVRPSSPQIAEKYASEAKLTLMDAYDDGAYDARLLAALGLYECTVGNQDQAQRFLEAAVQDKIARPRAYVELARIRLTAAIAKPAGARGKLDRSQVASALDLLRATWSQQPPQLDAYLLAAEAWENADFIPNAEELRTLSEGLQFFPDDPRLTLAAAQLYAAAGLKDDAVSVLERGLKRISDPTIRKLLVGLRSRYVGG